jgi:hypothetical protein
MLYFYIMIAFIRRYYISLIALSILAVGGIYVYANRNPLEKTFTLTIYSPKQPSYGTKLKDYDNGKYGTKDITEIITLDDVIVKKVKASLRPPYNLIRASADLSAEQVVSQAQVKIAGFTIENGTAYVVLNVDLDGWAGVHNTIAYARPLIYRTLLQFPSVQKVVFGYEAVEKTGLGI